MASHKQPSSLYNLAHKSTVTWLYNSCINIQRQHTSYDAEECVRAVHDLQTSCISTVPLFIWNDLCQRLLSLVDDTEQNTYGVVGEHLLDARFVAHRKIVYALVVHERLTHIKLISGMDSYYVDSSLYDQDISFEFWEKTFMKMQKVTKIVFSFIDWDRDIMWMFDVISKFCPDLQDITIPFNLSPEALTSLLKCTKLRRIAFADDDDDAEDGDSSLWSCFNRENCKRILESLPRLEYFNKPQLVECFLDLEDGHSLKLTHLVVYHPESTPAYVSMAVRICPNLKHLTFDTDCSTVLGILADSSINLTSLTCSDVSLSDNCERFFTMKGAHLLNLRFNLCYNSIAFKLITLIGEYCINLKNLNIKQKYLGMHQVGTPSASDLSLDHKSVLPTISPAFKKLTTLTLIDELGWDHRFFKWCVLHAANLETLTLKNLERPTLTAEDFCDMFASERFTGLVDVTCKLVFVSKEMIQCVYDNCPKLRKFYIESFDPDVGEYVESLQQNIASNNIDLALSYESALLSV